MPGHGVPTWTQVLRRRYEPWPPALSGRLEVDNIGDPAPHIAHVVTELRLRAAACGPDDRA